MTIEGGPNRVFTVQEEVTRAQIELADLQTQYNNANPVDDSLRMAIRNEYVARRMYIIDVEYSEYEVALTREKQLVGFSTATVAQGLSIAGSLFTPAQTTRILSGIAGGVFAIGGHYDKEVIVAKTIQIVQGHMRAQRDDIASKRILPMRTVSTLVYPLSAALHDLEDYYRAGTLAAGLIAATGEAGNAAQNAADDKAEVVRGTFGFDETANILRRYLAPGGRRDINRARRINRCLAIMTPPSFPPAPPIDIRNHIGVIAPGSLAIRLRAIECARSDPAFSPT